MIDFGDLQGLESIEIASKMIKKLNEHIKKDQCMHCADILYIILNDIKNE